MQGPGNAKSIRRESCQFFFLLSSRQTGTEIPRRYVGHSTPGTYCGVYTTDSYRSTGFHTSRTEGNVEFKPLDVVVVSLSSPRFHRWITALSNSTMGFVHDYGGKLSLLFCDVFWTCNVRKTGVKKVPKARFPISFLISSVPRDNRY